MAVVAWCQTVIRPGFHNLVKLTFAVISPGFGKSGLQESTATPTTVIVGPIGVHINKIFFTHNRLHNIPHVFSNWITETFPYQLAWILYRKLYFQILVPV